MLQVQSEKNDDDYLQVGVGISSPVDRNIPLSVAKNISHDLSVYVFNACKSSCDCCGCWTFGFQTFETHDDHSDDGTPPPNNYRLG